MNNNRLDEAALHAGGKGVFSKPSYITIGSKERPEEYDKKVPIRSSEKGKQLSIVPPKSGKTIDTYFEKRWPWINDGDKYQDRWRYKDMNKEGEKRGFLTSDFAKRDEFSNTIRTGQWREQLKMEDKFSKKAIQMFSESAGVSGSPGAYTDKHDDEEETFLYDLVFDKDDPNCSGASKTHRDTRNRTMKTKDRDLGNTMTTNALTYTPPANFSKPDYARKPVIRDTFYRGTNVFFPSSCSADPSA